MKKLLILLTACVALALTFAACGDDNNDDSGGSSSAGTTSTEQTDTTAAQKPSGGGGGTATVDIKDIQFTPKDITVKAGTTITWTNSDSIAHTVTKDDGPGADFDSGNVDGGATFEQKFDAPGTVNYVCTIHPGQSGTITVK
jgi:plastocyanin